MAATIYQFGDFQLDCGRFELLLNGRALRVERKPMELLVLLVSRQGQLVGRAEIAQRLWSSEVFVDTEHGINTAIRKLRHLLRDDPDNPRFIQTVTGMGYRFIAPTVSSENSDTDRQAAPAVELAASKPVNAPVGAALDASVDAPEVAPLPFQEPPKKTFFAQVVGIGRFVALTVLFIVMAVGPRQIAALLHRNANPPITSLAVIPLDNLSGDPNQEYFADGMTDELITMLAKDSSLRITSRTSVMQYKGARKPLQEIAHALNVDGIVEGSVSRANGRVHMNLQLIRADTDTHLWADSYDRDNTSVAALPNEAAREIAEHLHSSAGAAGVVRYVNPDAHDAYLHGRYLWFADQNEKAFVYFKKATELQPDYAPGWAGLAEYYAADTIEGKIDPATALQPMDEAALKAVQLDDSLAEPHLSLCAATFCRHWDLARADRECKRAIALDPKYAELYHFESKMLAAFNRHDEAIAAQKQAMELDPFSRPWGLVLSYMLARKYDAALEEARQRLESHPREIILQYLIADTYRRAGRDKEAEATLERVSVDTGDTAYAAKARAAFRRGGFKAIVREDLAESLRKSKTSYQSPVDLALYYAELGDREKALTELEEAYRQHLPQILWIQCDPAFDFLHADPRWRSLIQRIGLPPA